MAKKKRANQFEYNQDHEPDLDSKDRGRGRKDKKENDKAIKRALEQISQPGQTSEDVLATNLRFMEEKARLAGVSEQEIAFISEYYLDNVLADSEVAMRFAQNVEKLRGLSDDQPDTIVTDFHEDVADYLFDDFSTKIKNLTTDTGIPAEYKADRDNTVKELIDRYRSDPFVVIKKLEEAMREFGFDDREIKPLHDPTLPTPEELERRAKEAEKSTREELQKKKDEFNRLAAKIEARARAHEQIEADAREAVEEIMLSIKEARDAFDANPDEAIEKLRLTHETLESVKPTFEQMSRLADRYLAATVSWHIDDDVRKNAEEYIRSLLENFRDDPMSTFLEARQAVSEIEAEKIKADLFQEKLIKLKEVFVDIHGKDNFGKLSDREKRMFEEAVSRRKGEFLSNQDLALQDLDRVLAQKQAELDVILEKRRLEAEFKDDLTAYLDEAARFRGNLGMKNKDVDSERRGAFDSYLNSYRHNPDEAKSKMQEKMAEVQHMNFYASLLSARGLKGGTKYAMVDRFRECLQSDDAEVKADADLLFELEERFAEYLKRATAGKVSRQQIREAKDWLAGQLETNDDLQDILDRLNQEIEALPEVVEEDKDDDDTVTTNVDHSDDATDKIDRLDDSSDADNSSSVLPAAVAAFGAGAAAAAAVVVASDRNDAESFLRPPAVPSSPEVGVTETSEKAKDKINWKRAFSDLPWSFGRETTGKMIEKVVFWPVVQKVLKHDVTKTIGSAGGIGAGGTFYGMFRLGKGIWNFGKKLLGFDKVTFNDEPKKK